MRIVGDFDRRGQDGVVAQLCTLFGDEDRAPKIIDRRAVPMHGYRAVHVIVFPDGEPIEIQVRTARQHEWAELFEKLADLVGRGIRYGEPPRYRGHGSPRFPGVVIEHASMVAEMIALAEKAQVGEPGPPLPSGFESDVDRGVEQLRVTIHHLERMAHSD